MRSTMRTVIAGGLALLVLSMVAAASASAALPEFKPVPTKKKFTGTSGTFTVKSGFGIITCSKSTTAGEITSASTLGKVVVKFTGCKIENSANGETCSMKSPTGKEGEVITTTLQAELGTVKTTEAPSGVGLWIKQEGGEKSTKITTFEAPCATPTTSTVNGSLIGEVVTVGKNQLTNELVYKEQIHKITVKGGTKTAEFSYLGDEWGVAGSDALTFEEALEVT
jgi:hypothetical protein